MIDIFPAAKKQKKIIFYVTKCPLDATERNDRDNLSTRTRFDLIGVYKCYEFNFAALFAYLDV